MTKKDYLLVASVIQRTEFDSFADKAQFILDLGATLASANPKFDMHKWANACLPERTNVDTRI